MSLLDDVLASTTTGQSRLLPSSTALPMADNLRRWSTLTQLPSYNPPVGPPVDIPAGFDDLDALIEAAAALPDAGSDESVDARESRMSQVVAEMEAAQLEVLAERDD